MCLLRRTYWLGGDTGTKRASQGRWACACARDIAEAEVGADAGMGGSGGTGMARAVGVGGRDDGKRGVCCCCVFTLGLVVVDVRCGALVRRVGGGGKEEDTGDDRDVGV